MKGMRWMFVLGTVIMGTMGNMEKETAVTVDTIINEFVYEWKIATWKHPFLRDIRTKQMNHYTFNTWLVQHRIFADNFNRILKNVIIAAKKHAGADEVEAIEDGLDASNEELEWFDDFIKRRGLSPEARPLHATEDYMIYINHMMEEYSDNWMVLLVIVYTVEVVYQVAWRNVKKKVNIDSYIMKVAERWGSDEFAAYCAHLETLADKALADASEQDVYIALELVQRILEHQMQFWSMAQEAHLQRDDL